MAIGPAFLSARLAQLAERKALNLVVVGSSPTVGDFPFLECVPRAFCCAGTLARRRNNMVNLGAGFSSSS